LRLRIPKIHCTTQSRAGCFSLVSLFPSLRSPSYEVTAKLQRKAGTRLPEGPPFCADCESLKDQAQPGGSGPSVTDLQISPDYVYPSGMHTDSFNLSAELAMSLADNRNRSPGALMEEKRLQPLQRSSYSTQHATGCCQVQFSTRMLGRVPHLLGGKPLTPANLSESLDYLTSLPHIYPDPPQGADPRFHTPPTDFFSLV